MSDETYDDELTNRVLESAARVFRRDGYAKTRMHDIAVEAGTSTGAIYNRFRGKSELFAALLRPVSTEDLSGLLADARTADKLPETLASMSTTMLLGRPAELHALTAQALSGARADPDAQRVALARLAQSNEHHLEAITVGQDAGLVSDVADAASLAALVSLARLGAATLDGLDASIDVDGAMVALGALLRQIPSD
ncbi:MAG: helix-turn-helix domain-containing protein [Ilumatobacteraceae bacterium]